MNWGLQVLTTLPPSYDVGSIPWQKVAHITRRNTRKLRSKYKTESTRKSPKHFPQFPQLQDRKHEEINEAIASIASIEVSVHYSTYASYIRKSRTPITGCELK